MATAPTVQHDGDAAGFSTEFRLLTDADKPLIAFNDGDLSYFVTMLSDNETIHAVAQFRSMTTLSETEYRAAFPVVKAQLASELFTGLFYADLKEAREEVEADIAAGKLTL